LVIKPDVYTINLVLLIGVIYKIYITPSIRMLFAIIKTDFSICGMGGISRSWNTSAYPAVG
jgi:hypothetical protein